MSKGNEVVKVKVMFSGVDQDGCLGYGEDSPWNVRVVGEAGSSISVPSLLADGTTSGILFLHGDRQALRAYPVSGKPEDNFC